MAPGRKCGTSHQHRFRAYQHYSVHQNCVSSNKFTPTHNYVNIPHFSDKFNNLDIAVCHGASHCTVKETTICCTLGPRLQAKMRLYCQVNAISNYSCYAKCDIYWIVPS